MRTATIPDTRPCATHELSLRALASRMLQSILRPAGAFRHFPNDEHVSWPRALALIALIGCVDTLMHPYLVTGRGLWLIYPHDWLPFALGWACYDLNQWSCCVLFFLILNQWDETPVRSMEPFGVASFYLVGGLWLIALVADTAHAFGQLPILTIRMSGWHWLSGPALPLSARVSWLLIFPWWSYSLWIMLRHTLRFTRSWKVGCAAALAVGAPISGRLFVEQLPNLVMAAMQEWFHRHVSLGWAVLITHLILAGILGWIIWRWRRRMILVSSHDRGQCVMPPACV